MLPLMSRICLCVLALATTLYAYVDKRNDLIGLRLQIPLLEKEARAIHEENKRLEYEVDRFESPIHLMELSRKPEFSHLKYPLIQDVIILESKALP